MKSILDDPHSFVKVIMFLYGCSVIRYFIASDYARMTYWIAAFVLTFCITFWVKH